MRRITGMVVGFVGCLAAAASAGAQDMRPVNYPGTFVDRPLTLRGGDIRIDTRYQLLVVGPFDGQTNSVGVGAAVGITDRIEVAVTHTRDGSYDLGDATGFGLNVDRSGASFGDRIDNVYAALRFGIFDHPGFGMALEGGVAIPTHETSDVRLVAGLPMRARLGDHFNLDLAPELTVRFEHDPMSGDREANLDLHLPVTATIQLGTQAWFGAMSGVFWPSFDVDDLSVPLLMEVGYTVKHGYMPVVDFEVQAGWPALFVPGADDPVLQDLWMTRLNLRFFIAH